MPDVMQVVPKTYDLILWLVPRLKEFPRDQRFLLGERIQTVVLVALSASCAASLPSARRPTSLGVTASARGLPLRGSSTPRATLGARG